MARRSTDGESVTTTEAAHRLGMTKQALSEWAAKPDAPVVIQAGKKLCLWPQFPTWYRQMLIRSREKPTDLEDAKRRKLAAEAELAELQLARERGELIAVGDIEREVGTMCDRIRARLMAAPGRGAPLTVGLKTVRASQGVWESVIGEVLAELSA